MLEVAFFVKHLQQRFGYRICNRNCLSSETLKLGVFYLSLRIPMCQDSVEVRAATLRTIRYLISSDTEVQDFMTINGHFLLAKCLDIELDNKVLGFLWPSYLGMVA